MSDTKWTDGPWLVKDQFVVSVGSGFLHTQHTGNLGALVEEREANAHLIAAAPELYSELEKSNKLLAEAMDFIMSAGRDGLILANKINEQYPNNSIALRKARGK